MKTKKKMAEKIVELDTGKAARLMFEMVAKLNRLPKHQLQNRLEMAQRGHDARKRQKAEVDMRWAAKTKEIEAL